MAILFGGQALLPIPSHLAVSTKVAECGWVLAAFIVGTIVHEFGHAAAVRMVGERVLGIEFGGNLARRTLHLGTIPVSVGLGLGGRVTYPSARVSAARRAIVVAAGPLASLLMAPLCLLLPLPRWEAAYLALVTFASAVMDLVPASTAHGGSTDGAKLWQARVLRRTHAQVRGLLAEPDWLRRPDAADILVNGFRLDVPEAEDCLRELSHQPERRLRLYLQRWTLPDEPEADDIHIVHVLTWKVLTSGDTPAEVAELAADRAEWLLRHVGQKADTRTSLAEALHALALARLRQDRPDEAQRLCADALAADPEPADRASILATQAMSRHALQVSGRELLDQALAIDPDAGLVGEAVRVLARPRDVTAPVPRDQGQMAPGSPA